jgi:hypothetical protein
MERFFAPENFFESIFQLSRFHYLVVRVESFMKLKVITKTW